MNMQEISDRLTRANEKAEEALKEIINCPNIDRRTLEDCLKRYIASKLLLSEDEISDNIIQMVRINVAKASNMTIEQLKEMDRPGNCGSASVVLSKRVLVYLALQKSLGITLPTKDMPKIQTIQELTDMIFTLIQK